jgi:hypothetical protein
MIGRGEKKMTDDAAQSSTINWLLSSREPWTRFRTLVDLLDLPPVHPDVVAARAKMVAHPQVDGLIATAQSWPGYALKRHNDAKHPLYALSTLADFGMRYDDSGLQVALDKVLAHQSVAGAFQTKIRLYKRFSGRDGEFWTWMACDAPTLTYALVAMGMGNDKQVLRAVDHLLQQVQTNGWRCSAASAQGNFNGPGKREDACPIANVYALKVLSLRPVWANSDAVQLGTEALLWHWAHRRERKLRMFGIGTDFRKLKYPFVWYDILHVV